MTGRGRWSIALAVAPPLAALFLVFVFATFAGCTTTTGTACDCASPQITIHVPADIASSVTGAPLLSGPACTGVTAHCANSTNGCTAWDFTASAAGECDIAVDMASGTFTASVTIVSQSGCCAGFYPDSPASSTVDVPEPGDGG